MRNVIVTGIPRSGTTLAGALIDSIPDTVCLSEPRWHWDHRVGGPLNIGPDQDGASFAKWLVGDFVEIRQKLITGQPVQDMRDPGGSAVTNYYKVDAQSKKMERTFKIVNVVRPGLSKDFTLAIKHNGPYLTALYPIIHLNWFTIIGMIRNPVDTLYSWQTISLPVSGGKMEDAARCWPRMYEATNSGASVLERQVKIYDLICERFYTLRKQVKVLHYESMVANPGLLCEYIGVPDKIDRKLVTDPGKKVPDEVRQQIINAFKMHGKFYSYFYPDLG